MGKTAAVLLAFFSCLSVASLLIGPKELSKTRIIKAGGATLSIPQYFPREVMNGTDRRGAVIIGEMDERCICYEQFLGVYWSDRPIPNADLLPAPAYRKMSGFTISSSRLSGDAPMVKVKLSARKPCGKIVKAELNIIKKYCKDTNTHFAITALRDPLITEGKLLGIANSLKCP